jgi:imidazole glycerol phosphate synthase glutamine amidotransferase subunit
VNVLVVETGTANTASVLAGLRRAGGSPEVLGSRDVDRGLVPEIVARADRVVLPGVGAFAAARAALDDQGVTEALAQRVRDGRPTLAICLGLQLFAAASEESPGAEGLCVWDATVRRFRGDVRVPQLGWNDVVAGEGCRLLRDGCAYFANSYRLDAVPSGWSGALSDHGGPFVAAVERGAVLACQFHPELSGAWGQDLLRRWLEA